MSAGSFQGWIASLSNGETVLEKPTAPGEKSAWQKLLDVCTQQGIRVTQLRLRRGEAIITCDFHKKTQGFCQAYESTQVLYRGGVKLEQGIGSIVDGLVFMNWIDDYGNVRQDIRPIAEMKIHSTLRDQIYGENS